MSVRTGGRGRVMVGCFVGGGGVRLQGPEFFEGDGEEARVGQR